MRITLLHTYSKPLGAFVFPSLFAGAIQLGCVFGLRRRSRLARELENVIDMVDVVVDNLRL